MTYNLFQGSELTEASNATTPAQFLAAVAEDYGEVQATDFPERAQAIAAEAQSAAPDLIGIQEAWEITLCAWSLPTSPTTATLSARPRRPSSRRDHSAPTCRS
jgi:hypothetical protein